MKLIIYFYYDDNYFYKILIYKMFIYILKLKSNKYYIGKSRNISTLKNRIRQHYTYRGSVWTKKYKPEKIIDVIKCEEEDKYIEDKFVFDYMNKYGIENVRGGSFCQVKLGEEEKRLIKRIIQTEEDRCFYCNSKEHLVSECIKYKNRKSKRKEREEKIEEINDKPLIKLEDLEYEDELYVPEQKKESCCGKIIKLIIYYSGRSKPKDLIV